MENVSAEEYLMVDNDVGEDMITQKIGMQVFLLTDCLVNKVVVNISRHSNGSFPELASFLNAL